MTPSAPVFSRLGEEGAKLRVSPRLTGLRATVERAVRYGNRQYAHKDGCPAIARPVLSKGHLAKVVVAVVPDGNQAVLGPKRVAPGLPARRRRPVLAVTEVRPW